MGRSLAGVTLAVLCLVGQASAEGPKTLLTLRDEPKRGHGVWAALSPDGKLLGLSCNGEVTVRVLHSGKVLQRLKRLTSADGEVAHGLVFSPDNKQLLFVDVYLRLMNIEDGKARQLTSEFTHPRHLGFSPAGASVVTREKDHGLMKYELPRGERKPWVPLFKRISDVGGHDQLALSKDGKWLAHNARFEGDNYIIGLLSLKGPRASWVALKGHKGDILALTFSADGKTLISASTDQTIKVWDLATGKEKANVKSTALALPKGTFPRLWAYFSPDGSLLACVSYTHGPKARAFALTLVDAKTGKALATTQEKDNRIKYAGFLPDSKAVIYVLPGSKTLKSDKPTIVRKLEAGTK
jgi:WD40 repeat protein